MREQLQQIRIAWRGVMARIALSMVLSAISSLAQDKGKEFRIPEEERLKAPDVVYRTPAGDKDRRPLHGWVVGEDPGAVVMWIEEKPGMAAHVKIDRSDIQKIEYFETYMLTTGDEMLAAGKLDEAERRYANALRSAKQRINITCPCTTRSSKDGNKERSRCPLRGANTQGSNSGTLKLVPTLNKRLKGAIPFARGKEREAKGFLDDALEFYDFALKFDPNWPELKSCIENILLGRAQSEMARGIQGHGDARNWIEEFLRRYPKGSKRSNDLQDALKKSDEELREEIRGLFDGTEGLCKQEKYEQAESTVLQALDKAVCLAGVGAQKQEDAALEKRLRELRDEIRDKYRVMKYGELEFPTTFCPIVARLPCERRICQLLFDGLLDWQPKETGGYTYRLAEDLKADKDGLTYTFELRRDVKWSDGTPFTARDVLFTVEVMKNPKTSGYSPMWASVVDRAERVNPFCVRIHFAKQYIDPKAMLMFKILPRHPFTEPVLTREDKFCREPVGTGPFAIQKITPNQQVEMVRNELFWGERPELSKIVMVYYQDAVTRTTQLENGDIHMVTDVEPMVLARFQKLGEDKFRNESFQARSANFLAMNFRKELFSDKRTRLGVIHAIDRHAILERLFFGEKGGLAHSVLTGIYPIGCPLHNDKVKEYPFASSQAQMNLETVGKNDNPGPVSLKFKRGDQKVEDACARMADLMTEAGLNVRVEKKIEGDLMGEVYDEHDFDMAYWQYDFDDTWDAYPLFDADGVNKGGANFMGYRYGPLSELFKALAHEPDSQGWVTIGKEIHRMIHDDLAIIPLWQLDSYLVYSARLQNVKIHPYYLFAFPERWTIQAPEGP